MKFSFADRKIKDEEWLKLQSVVQNYDITNTLEELESYQRQVVDFMKTGFQLMTHDYKWDGDKGFKRVPLEKESYIVNIFDSYASGRKELMSRIKKKIIEKRLAFEQSVEKEKAMKAKAVITTNHEKKKPTSLLL